PRAQSRLPLERRRHGRRLRPQPDALLRARALEREGPDPKGARLRSRRTRRQSRRGCKGALLLRGRNADLELSTLSLPLYAVALPLRGARSWLARARSRASRA